MKHIIYYATSNITYIYVPTCSNGSLWKHQESLMPLLEKEGWIYRETTTIELKHGSILEVAIYDRDFPIDGEGWEKKEERYIIFKPKNSVETGAYILSRKWWLNEKHGS